MAYLVAAIVLLSALAILNLLLTYGVIRRLRQHTEQLSKQSSKPDTLSTAMLPAGSRVADFTASTTDAQVVELATLTEQTLVAFFSPHCDACKIQLPSFLTLAGSWPRQQVVAAVHGPADDAAELVAQLSPVAQTMTEMNAQAMATAFDVEGFPSFCIIEPDGTVIVSGFTTKDVRTPVAA